LKIDRGARHNAGVRRLILALLLTLGLAVPALADEGEKKKGGGETFVTLPTLTATTVRPTNRHGVLTVEAGLDIADKGLRERAEDSKPRLRDAYVDALQTQAAAIAPGAAPDPDAIAAALQRATDRVLGKSGARLLIGTVMVN
jgi:hypothetical protein